MHGMTNSLFSIQLANRTRLLMHVADVAQVARVPRPKALSSVSSCAALPSNLLPHRRRTNQQSAVLNWCNHAHLLAKLSSLSLFHHFERVME